MQHSFRVMQEVGLTGNRLFRNDDTQNGVIIRRTQFKLCPAVAGGNFSAPQTLGANKSLFAARGRNTKPERVRPDKTRLTQRQSGVFTEHLNIIEQDFRELAMKFSRM